INCLPLARSPQLACKTDKPIYKVIAIPTHSVCLTVFRVCTLLTMTPTTLQPHRSVPVVLGILTFGLGFGLGFALPPLVGLLQTALESSPFPTTEIGRASCRERAFISAEAEWSENARRC